MRRRLGYVSRRAELEDLSDQTSVVLVVNGHAVHARQHSQEFKAKTWNRRQRLRPVRATCGFALERAGGTLAATHG